MRSAFYRMSGVVLFVALAGILTGCGDGKAAITFNDNIVRSLQQLTVAEQKFGDSLKPFSQGGSPKAADVRQAHKEAIDVLTAVKAEIPTWKIPARESAQNLHQSFLSMMKTQEAGIMLFGEVATVVEDAKLSNDMKGQRIQQIFQKLQTTEQVALMDLQNKQRTFAKDHNIKLIVK